MKLHCETVINRLDGQPFMTDQEVMQLNGRPLTLNGQPQLTAGRPLTVGDALATIFTTKKLLRFSPLKAYALAQRFYKAELIEIDDSDYSNLREVIENNDQFTPLVLAQILQTLMDAKG